MTIKTERDRYVVATRRFAAPPAELYRARTNPKLIQREHGMEASYTRLESMI
jgi:uncharacterized protein YndB with AHSA1/START domain